MITLEATAIRFSVTITVDDNKLVGMLNLLIETFYLLVLLFSLPGRVIKYWQQQRWVINWHLIILSLIPPIGMA